MAQGWGRAGFGTDYWGATSVSVTLGTLAITSGVGSPSTTAKANVTLGTLVATSAIGSVTVYENEIINAPSFSITSSLGSVTTSAEATATITDSLAITTDLGLVLVWGDINESQSPSYSVINESQTPSYSVINESQTPDWQEEAA